MGWLSRFRRRNARRASLVCYLRENGPIAYASDLFGGDRRERAEAMLSTPLAWYWKTSTAEHFVRDWTLLTRWSLAALLADLAAEHDGLKPHIVAIGIDPQDTPDDVTDGRAAAWMRGF